MYIFTAIEQCCCFILTFSYLHLLGLLQSGFSFCTQMQPRKD